MEDCPLNCPLIQAAVTTSESTSMPANSSWSGLPDRMLVLFAGVANHPSKGVSFLCHLNPANCCSVG